MPPRKVGHGRRRGAADLLIAAWPATRGARVGRGCQRRRFPPPRARSLAQRNQNLWTDQAGLAPGENRPSRIGSPRPEGGSKQIARALSRNAAYLLRV